MTPWTSGAPAGVPDNLQTAGRRYGGGVAGRLPMIRFCCRRCGAWRWFRLAHGHYRCIRCGGLHPADSAHR